MYNWRMPITLNHTIVPSRDKEGSARFFARIFGLDYAGLNGHFAQVRINGDLAFDWDNSERFESHHYAFVVNDKEFDDIFGRLQGEHIAYGSGPFSSTDGEINHRRGGRGLYFSDPDGHLLEIMTVPE
jgi:catechol 2,3-dioxygenase-like lactoylglutathione lyase family enzyme